MLMKSILAMLLIFAIGLPCLAATQPIRVFYYRDNENARNSLYRYYDSIDVLAPQSYAINGEGKLESEINRDIVNFALLHGVKVMPLVTNKGFSQAAIKATLDDHNKQDEIISDLIAEARKQGYYGWQIDFEQMDETYRDKFTSFISKFGKAMKGAGLVSSVAVIAKISDNPADYKKDLWQKLIGVYDYSALSSSTDFVSVMSYDDPESKGPVARYSWLVKVIEYTKSRIPAEKISLGIPLYYWKWDDRTQKLVGIGGSEGIETAKQKYRVAIGYSATEKAPYMRYVQNKRNYTLWFENAESIGEKLKLISRYNLLGFSAWALGLEVPIVHQAIRPTW